MMDSHTYVYSNWLFLRFLAVIYFAAFVSLGVQIKGLIGSGGILPVKNLVGFRFPGKFEKLREFFRFPTLCWWNSSDRFLAGLCWGGAGLSVLLFAGIAPVPVAVCLWLFYLSLMYACGIFLTFQWDALLVEMGFLGIFFTPAAEPFAIARWLALWLLFRLVFSSGAVKLLSEDPAWRNLTALCYHYETQPLPTPLSWFLHQYPVWFQKLSCAVMFFIELVVPFFVFAPPPVSYVASGLIFFLMMLIFATGNYCFFNLQAIALSLWVFDDAFLHKVFPGWNLSTQTVPMPVGWNLVMGLAGLIILLLSIDILALQFRRAIRWPEPIARLMQWVLPFRIVNGYGLFAVMTTSRPEIIVEASHDGRDWLAYEFKWKPGDLKRMPAFVEPHQPRLDWQMWFAALGSYLESPWFSNFLERLLEGSPDVIRLLKHNPFPEKPPKYIRALLYDYHFTNANERFRSGYWWRRKLIGVYFPPVSS